MGLRRYVRRSHIKRLPSTSSRPNLDSRLAKTFQALFLVSKDQRPDSVDDLIDISWYPSWLSRQLREMPLAMADICVLGVKISQDSALMDAFAIMKRYISETEACSIDEIVEHLRSFASMEASPTQPDAQRLLVFAILGWQTMLYTPAFNVCSYEELAIHSDNTHPDSGLVFDTYKIPADLADRPLSVLLKSFGNLLPARNHNLHRLASENSAVASSWQPIYPSEMNISNLQKLLHVSIHWTDTLALHLDFDQSSRTLSLFSCPSMCLAMLRHGGPIHGFASVDSSAIDPRGTREDITQYLKDVLLSYRLLFAQSAASRKIFRRTFKPIPELAHKIDTLLPLLCTSTELSSVSDKLPQNRPIYFAARDFPVLHDRMELLASELRGAKPKSILDLLHDRRDTLQYWTFWLVSIIGGSGLLLSLVQVVLQALQVVYTVRASA